MVLLLSVLCVLHNSLVLKCLGPLAGFSVSAIGCFLEVVLASKIDNKCRLVA